MKKFAFGQLVRFDGKSADDKVNESLDVTIINPHSNAQLVASISGSGEKFRAYDTQGHRHVAMATVENSRGKIFEAYHHSLHVIR